MSLHPVLAAVAIVCGLGLAFFVYAVVRYTPVICRIFSEPPALRPLRHEPEPGNEEVRFSTRDGLDLAGTYFRTRRTTRVGVVVFCHEYLGDRWSALPYAGCLRDLGFDLFSFDFRNHGDSGLEPSYEPLQWVSDREVLDVEAALDYLRTRDDHDDAGFGLYGISRGGGAAMVVGSSRADVWGVVTDGAFPTDGTMLAYILKWAEIYVSRTGLWKLLPTPVYAALGRAARRRAEWGLDRTFVSIERAAARLSPRPLLMIHGARDSYIKPAIARSLFDCAAEPKELWIVPDAKHNGGRERDPGAYRERIGRFFHRWAPRRLTEDSGNSSDSVYTSDPSLASLLAQPVPAI